MSETLSTIAQVAAIIPARYQSSRFPGKPLASIAGKSLIQRTYERAKCCPLLQEVLIATDDERIYSHVQSFGGTAVYTSPDCLTGTDRLIDVLQQGYCRNAACILNVQGDLPLIEPEVMQQVIEALLNDSEAATATAVVPLTGEEAHNFSVVKCVLDQKKRALYFSRALIPAGLQGDFKTGIPYYHHIGIYAYRPHFLLELSRLPPTPLQLAEDLEQLKILEYGHRIAVAIVNSASFGVDRPEDIQKVENILCMQNLSSSLAASALL